MGEIDIDVSLVILLVLGSPVLIPAIVAVTAMGWMYDSVTESVGNVRNRIAASTRDQLDDVQLPSGASKLYHLLYRYACEGRLAAFTAAIHKFKRERCDNEEEYIEFFSQLSPSGNTLVHTAVSCGHREMALMIKNQHHQLLEIRNFEGDTALHVAAKVGTQKRKGKRVECDDLAALVMRTGDEYIAFLAGEGIDTDKYGVPLLSVKNNEENTPLHEALIHGNLSDATLFILMDSSTSFIANMANKSPLYLAAEQGLPEIVDLMIRQHTKSKLKKVKNQGGDCLPIMNSEELVVEGKSPLHAAVLGRNKDVLKNLSRMKHTSDAALPTDEKGRTPLHCASSTGYLEGVRFLLQKCTSYSRQRDNSGAFPIHYATSKGYVEIVKVFLRHCPDLKELRNSRGENILHIAARCGRDNLVKYFLKRSDFKMLINQKDDAGNTPLHLATIYRRPLVTSILTWDKRTKLNLLNASGMTALDVAESTLETIALFHGRLTWIALKSAGAQRCQSLHILLQNKESAGVLNSSSIPTKESIKDRVNTLLMVTTLIATVSFAAGFTMPGGYNNSGPNEGMATLLHRAMFQMFVICNAIAMYSSVVVAVTLIWAQLGDLYLVSTALHFALPLLGIALTMFSLAFMAGVFVVVSSLQWLATVVLAMGSEECFFSSSWHFSLHSTSLVHLLLVCYVTSPIILFVWQFWLPEVTIIMFLKKTSLCWTLPYHIINNCNSHNTFVAVQILRNMILLQF